MTFVEEVMLEKEFYSLVTSWKWQFNAEKGLLNRYLSAMFDMNWPLQSISLVRASFVHYALKEEKKDNVSSVTVNKNSHP